MKETYNGIKTPKEEKTPLELLQDVMYGNAIDGTKDQAYEDLKQAITPPSSDEVCKALSEYLEIDVELVYRSFVGDDDICYQGEDNLIIFNYDLPPHLITLIGRFYVGLEHD